MLLIKSFGMIFARIYLQQEKVDHETRLNPPYPGCPTPPSLSGKLCVAGCGTGGEREKAGEFSL